MSSDADEFLGKSIGEVFSSLLSGERDVVMVEFDDGSGVLFTLTDIEGYMKIATAYGEASEGLVSRIERKIGANPNISWVPGKLN